MRIRRRKPQLDRRFASTSCHKFVTHTDWSKSVSKMLCTRPHSLRKNLLPMPVDLRPPMRAESIDLRALVSHRTATQSGASMETVFEIFKNGIVNFAAVLDRRASARDVFATRNGGVSRWTLRVFALGAKADRPASLQARDAHQGRDAYRRCLARCVCASGREFL